jgi:1-acyl-sn-glycerol-3-phosphate acyltransferase
LGKYEIFKYKFTNWLFTKAGVIPVHRQRKDHAALESAEEYLKAGALVALYPEATIIKPEGVRILPFKMGAIKMAYDTGCPIVPFTINGKYIPIFGKISITFHEPFYVESDDLEAEREKLVQKVCAGLNPPLREGERLYTKE